MFYLVLFAIKLAKNTILPYFKSEVPAPVQPKNL